MKNPHVTNDRRYLLVLAILQNHNNSVFSNGFDKVLRSSSLIGSYYLVVDKADLQVITGESVTNDLSVSTNLRIARTYLSLLRSYSCLRHFVAR